MTFQHWNIQKTTNLCFVCIHDLLVVVECNFLLHYSDVKNNNKNNSKQFLRKKNKNLKV